MTGRCADPPPQPKVVTYIMRSLFVLAVLSLAACGDNPPINYPTTPPAQEVEPVDQRAEFSPVPHARLRASRPPAGDDAGTTG